MVILSLAALSRSANTKETEREKQINKVLQQASDLTKKIEK